MKTNNKKILIVGAGIAGLSLAIMCDKRGIRYDIIEKSVETRLQGYSVTIPPAGLAALRELGVYDDVVHNACIVEGVLLATSENRFIDFGKNNLQVMTVRRTDLHTSLLSKIKQPVRYNTSFHPTAGMLSDYDLIVGADGLHSQVRAHILPHAAPQSTGVAFWTCFVPEDLYGRFSSTHITQYWRDGKFVGVFPLHGGACVVFSAHLPPSVDLSEIDLSHIFGSISNDLDEVASRIDQSAVYRGHLHEIKLSSWQSYPYVLVGDAAHAMMPATGMGSTAGMIDAIKLTDYLIKYDDWRGSLKRYEMSRLLSARTIQTTSRLVTSAMLATGVRGSFNKKAAQLLPDSFFAQIFR